MAVFYLLFIMLYVLLLWSIKRQWRQQTSPASDTVYESRVALLVPFRDEAEHLPGLMELLDRNAYPLGEVIFIDDDSSDQSAGIVSGFIQKNGLGNWALLKSIGIGKKAALTTGVHFSQADIILTTDADCVLPRQWVEGMVRPFMRQGIQLVAGPVMTGSGTGFFSRFQQVEWASIVLLTKYFFSIQRPTMCSGANLAYRRSAFLAVEGYLENEKHLSGDDEFLLKKIVKQFGAGAVTYLHQKETLVETRPHSSWSGFIQQRIRWSSKWRLHRSWDHAFSAALAFAVALVQLGSWAMLFGNLGEKLTFIIFWVLKVGVDRVVLGKVLADFHVKVSLWVFLASSFLHPIYVVWVGIRAMRGKYTWKGRNNRFNL